MTCPPPGSEDAAKKSPLLSVILAKYRTGIVIPTHDYSLYCFTFKITGADYVTRKLH